MRKRMSNWVCGCTPNGVVTHLETRILREIVNHDIHPIRCASTCGRKAQKVLIIGDLCAEAHHPMWALKIWKFVLSQIHSSQLVTQQQLSVRDSLSALQLSLHSP